MAVPLTGSSFPLRGLLVGIVGGGVSVLMFFSAIRGGGDGLSLALLPLLPLPTLIAALGWGLATAVAALATAGVLSAFIATPVVAIGFTLMVGLPSLGLTYLASLARYDADGALVHWYPPGKILFALTLYGAAVPVLLAALGGGSFDPMAPDLLRVLKVFAAAQPAESFWRTIDDRQLTAWVDLWVRVMPAVIAIYWTLFFSIDAYLAARIVQVSDLLPRPWPNLHWLSLPMTSIVALALAILGIVAGGAPRVLGIGALGALLIAFLLQGLSVLHAVARARSAGWSLFGVYASLILFGGLTMPMIALLGVTETLFHVRRQIIPTPSTLPLGSI